MDIASSHKCNILFVCMGNSCRSPMAHFLFKDIVKRNNLNDYFKIYSAAVSKNELKDDFCDETKKQLKKWNIPFRKRKPVRITKKMCTDYDYIICMDTEIKNKVLKIDFPNKKKKVFKFLDFSSTPIDIVDPVYTKDFNRTFTEISFGCYNLFIYLLSKFEIKINTN